MLASCPMQARARLATGGGGAAAAVGCAVWLAPRLCGPLRLDGYRVRG